MCQAYEGERNLVIGLENNATVKGFAAARAGKPRKSNPYHREYERSMWQNWDHGWSCWQKKPFILPWALESELPFEERAGARLRFEKTRELPDALLRTVDFWGRMAEADAILKEAQ